MVLGPRVYDCFQRAVVGDASVTYKIFKRMMGFQPGMQVLDFGCGTGIIAENFRRDNISYLGVDLNRGRIGYAIKKNPTERFICGDITQSDPNEGIDFTYIVAHGVLHHIEDNTIRELLSFFKSRGCRYFGCMEPLLPVPWYTHPLAAVTCWLDDGNFIRPLEEYVTILQACSRKVAYEKFGWKLYPTKNAVFVAEL